MKNISVFGILILLTFFNVNSQQTRKANIAIIQAEGHPNQDPFMNSYDYSKVRPQMKTHLDNLLALFEEAGKMGADLVCGPEDIQHIGSYGLYIDTKDPETGEILFSSLAEPVPGPLTDRVAEIARKSNMYIIAPMYEASEGKVFNTAVIFDRQGNIIGKHRKTVLPVMETWLVSTGDEYEVYKTDFGTIAIATCWELSYPEISTIYALKGADIIFNPTMARDNIPGESLSTANMIVTRAKDNSVYVAPVVLGSEGNGIIDFNGNVAAEAPGKKNTVIMAEIDFSKERIADSKWWETINGTNNLTAIHNKSRRPDTYGMLTDQNPPLLEKYKEIHLTTGNRESQIEAVKAVDYGPGPDTVLTKNVLKALGLNVIPFPKEVTLKGEDFNFSNEVKITLDKNHSASDRFAAEELIKDLKNEFGINARINSSGEYPSIILRRDRTGKTLHAQGYQLTSGEKEVIILGKDEEGLFYGTQTLLQLIKQNAKGYKVPGISIKDWPDIENRAIHYDTKHHQDKASYVKSFIKDLARYKVNMLVWEWEDKFAYPSHLEIGAPGAFTMAEMQEFTRFARQYHIQIVPLVQGLGHVSFILKWPQFKNLREIESSNWEFCPLKEGSYTLLFDLWKDAIEATPGSEYLHIGSDETYELGVCDQCKAKAAEIGRSGLYLTFINKAAEYLSPKGRKTMAWETPMGWEASRSPAIGIKPAPELVLAESYNYETPDLTYIKKANSQGYKVFAYDPNPGVVPLMVPYIFEKGERGNIRPGSLEKSYNFLSSAARTGVFNGMICTSWDDDDLHNQMWMMHFVNAAACSWNGSNPGRNEFMESFFANCYGSSAADMDELFKILNEGAYYFAGTMERNVWHYGEIGQTHLPDLPRGDALEYDPYWNTRYKEKVIQSEQILGKMDRALQIISENKNTDIRHNYDFEIFRTSAELVKHTCQVYIDLSNLEKIIKKAHINRFLDSNVSLNSLIEAQNIVENILTRRSTVFNDLVSVYEQTRLPKGLSTENKEFFWQQDRARHFAFRRPDMSFLIYDEQLLNLEGYFENLKSYITYFKENSMN
ncbi:MAG TPA: nitrilase-related carbon-nitrogen hydrolase [Bacteroidales bacterium]|nr:nitrilase-related carbon-nitrogen hydrolase [Bacteroidales bacterium]